MGRPSLLRRDGWKRSICCYCGVGCGLKVQTKNGVVSAVRGDEDHPVNQGKLCAKAALLPDIFVEEARLLHPQVRDVKGSEPRRASWDEAIERAAGAIRRAVDQHGPDSVMLYGSGQLVTEDYYLFGKLAKGYIGTNNQDTNSRLCMASAVTAYNMTFGSDAPPAGYADIEQANTFLIVGANMEACHPILFERIKARKRAAKDRVEVIVVDPRATRTTEIADLHLALRPGTDVALLQSLLFEVRLAGGLDHTYLRNHTSGWEQVEESLAGWSAERAVEVTGLDAGDILEAARIIAHNGPMLTFWTMGANQSTSGVDKNLALINLSLATGNIGKPGAGPMSLTGQPNAMGGREQGGLATTLPGHRLVANPEHRAEVEQAWGIPPGSISDRPGVTAIEMVERLERGQIKVIWVAATNPVASLPNSDRVRAAFAQAETVIVQDAYQPTETTQIADILLPAAQWSERGGTMTNSERRICLLEQVSPPPGEALPDWQIICRVAEALGFGDAFQYDGLEEIFREYRELSRGRDMDITGISYPLLAQHRAGIQWPYPSTARSGPPRDGRRLFEDGQFQTPDGRAQMQVPRWIPPADAVNDDYPFALITGRVKDQWHTMTRTGRSTKLLRSEKQPFLEINASDAIGLGIGDRDRVRIISRRGAFESTARVNETIRAGSVFAPFHWGALWSDDGPSNRSANEAIDPRSKQPELKFAAVRVEPLSAD
ncbi:MAG: nitrate reductase [Chloroflexi bacterium]|nr:nitrate reductase [Chloroflexota bacterium]MCY3588320.1 nitrate reductase [Chloroflexota bacterium]MCY3684861.1 nitrate reductase [Chloroflexota bacterium]MDE2708691.1 nitrate reductase [Chloroflexota bacterium]